MTAENAWFLIAIGGILLALEGAASGAAKMNTRLPEWGIKLAAGVVIILIALFFWPKS